MKLGTAKLAIISSVLMGGGSLFCYFGIIAPRKAAKRKVQLEACLEMAHKNYSQNWESSCKQYVANLRKRRKQLCGGLIGAHWQQQCKKSFGPIPVNVSSCNLPNSTVSILEQRHHAMRADCHSMYSAK